MPGRGAAIVPRIDRSLVPAARLAAYKERLRRRSTTTTPGPPVSPAAAGPQVSSPLGFDANAEGSPLATPSDTTGALGTSAFVAAVNVKVSVYDLTGSPFVGFPIRLRTIGGLLPAGAFDFDPRVVFDQYDNEFILVFLAADNTHSFIELVAMPGDSADDPTTWCATRINGDQFKGDGKQFADYPGLGYTADRVTVTTNNFPFTGPGYDYGQILSFHKGQLYDCSAPKLTIRAFGGRDTRNPDGSKSFSTQPAQTTGGTSPTTQYLLEFTYAGRFSGKALVLWRLREASGVLNLTRTTLPVGSVRIPPVGTQGGGSIGVLNTEWDTGDAGLVNAFYDVDVDRVYAAHAVEHDFSPGDGYVESGVRWYEVQPAGNLGNSAVTRKGFVGQSMHDDGWPVVATDKLGNLYLNYAQASAPADEFLSVYAAAIPPASTTPSTLLLKAGQGRYETGPGEERWGDFGGINRGPSDGDSVWMFGAYAFGTGTTPLWRQWVSGVTTP